MSQGPRRARAVAIALRRRRPQPQPDWMWIVLAVLLALGLILARPLYAQTSVPPAPPERIAPTIPPGAGGDTQTVRPLPDTSAKPPVVAPPVSGDAAVIRPPVAGTMPVIPPPGAPGGVKGVQPK